MSEHQALYRKWRPQTFSDVVNQAYAIQTLVNAVATGGVGHAYLFAGPRGTGKTTVARLFAKAVNCQNSQNGEPCNQCDACRRIARGAVLDVVEIDGASNRGIDQIRKLREEVNFVPADVTHKVYIIDEVHMLTNEAFNALLKTLEEPPKRVIFVFATTELHKLPPTVTSRCQAFEFTRIPPDEIVTRLKTVAQAEGIQVEERALHTIAARSGGALRDALVTLEQVAAYAQSEAIRGETLEAVLGLPGEPLLQAFLQAVLNGDGQSALDTIDDLSRRGRDLELFLEELIRKSRDWLVDVVGKKPLPIDAAPPALARLTQHLLALKRDMGRAWDKKILLEVGVLQWIHADATSDPTTESRVVARPSTGAAQPQAEKPSAVVPNPDPVVQKSAEPEKPSQTETQPTSLPPAKSEPAQPQPPAPPQSTIELSQAWRGLLDAIRDERMAVYAYLVEGHPQFHQNTLSVMYQPGHRFHKESVEKDDVSAYVLEKARPIFGATTTLSVGFLAEDPEPEPKSEPHFSDSPGDDAPSAPNATLDEKVALVERVLGSKDEG